MRNFFKASKNKTLLKYLSSSFMGMPVSIITGIITFRNIEPKLIGIWTAVAIVETYSRFLSLGVINGMNRELPYALGTGNEAKAYRFAETTFAYSVFQIILLICVVPVLLLKFELTEYYLVSIIAISIKITFSLYASYLAGTFRSNDNFNSLSNIQFYLLILQLLGSPLIILGFYGYIAYQVIIVIVSTYLLHKYRPLRIKPVFHKFEFIQLLKIGLPIFFTSYLIGIIDTFPKLYILKYGNESLLGIYAPVVMLLGAFDLLPGALSTYLYPKYSFGFGQNNNARIILKNMFKIQGITIISIVGMIIIGYFLLPYFGLFFPKYQQSMPYLQLALIIGPFIVHKIGTMIYVVLREMKFLYIQLVLYAITQSMTLLIIGKFYSNVLLIVMYASIFTAVIMFIFNVFLNLWAVKVYERHRVVVV